MIAHFEEAAGFRSGDDDAAKVSKLHRLLSKSPGFDEGDVALFAGLLSIAIGGKAPATALSAQRRKELLLERFAALIAGLGQTAPVLIVLEDAHWIDPTTRELFDLMIERARTMRVLLVMTYRPEFAPPWLGQAHVTTLTLTRLDRPSNLALVRRVAGGKALPEDVVDEILAKADGIPLFVEEVTKSVLESGSVRESAGRYVRVEPESAFSVPATLQASLVARIDRLAAIRGLVQTSAALGREFSYRALRSVSSLDDAALIPAIAQFVASGLVHQRGAPPDARYAFKHALVQEAAYETMIRPHRVEVHRRIAEVLQREFPEMPAFHPDVLAHHCTEGGLWEQAIEFSISAARMAVERSAGVEAEARVERAIALLPKVGDEARRMQLEGRLNVALADALIMTQGFASPNVNAALTRARSLLRRRDHPDASLRALCGLFNYHLIRSESPTCLSLVAPLLKQRLARPQANVVQYLAGTAHLHLGNFDDTIRHLEAARSLYHDDACRDVAFVGGYHLHSFTLIWLGLAYLYVGRFDAAAATIVEAVADARKRAHPFTLVSALLAEARFRSHRHDVEAAVAATEEGLAIATEQRSPYHVSRAAILRAVNTLDGGNAAQAITLMEAALAAHKATGANFQSSYNLSRLAEAYAGAGRHERALQLADAAIAEVKRSGERWWEAEAERVRGEILLLADPRNHGAAERCFIKSRATAKRQHARLWEINAVNSLAALWRARGRDDDARKILGSLQ